MKVVSRRPARGILGIYKPGKARCEEMTKLAHFLILVVMLLCGLAAAHQGHSHESAAPPAPQSLRSAGTAESRPTAGAAEKRASGSSTEAANDDAGAPAKAGESREAFVAPPLRAELTSHLHNKTVHFPIAYAFGALVLLLLSLRRSDLAGGAYVLIILGAVAGIAALFFGLAQGKEFEGTAKEWLLELHERLGYGAAGSLAAWSAMIFIPSARRYAWIWGFVVSAVVTVTAYYGGILALVD